MLRGTQRGIFQRLQELTEGLRIAHELVELHQALFLRLQHVGCATGRDTRLAQQVRRIAVLRAREKYQQKVVEKAANLLAHGRVLLVFKSVQQ